MACQHFPDDQTLRLQAGAGEYDVIHLPSGLDRVDCERQEEEGLQETELMDYVDKQIRQAQERQDRLTVRREEEANRRQLELAAIKERRDS